MHCTIDYMSLMNNHLIKRTKEEASYIFSNHLFKIDEEKNQIREASTAQTSVSRNRPH